ncbi:hypothetical protein BDW72DRAFT_205548 [Aspergillus terricola var. indicus]
MSTPNTTFHLFHKLPTEIRWMIWRECLPNRVMELDHQVDELLWDEDDDPPSVAFESGSRQPSPSPRIAEMEDILDFSKYMLRRPWLDKKQPWGQSYEPSHFRWTRSELADLMRTWPCWRVVVLPPMIIHTDVETAAGFFGLLSDARLQLVAADDEAGIDRFLALGGKPNVTITPEFRREQLPEAKKELRDVVKAVFGSEERSPVMQPFVMFRLCARFCK